MYKFLILDMNNLFWIAFHNTVNEENKHKLIYDGIDIYPKVIPEAISMIKNIVERFGSKESVAYLLYDNPDTEINIRKLVSDGEYKSAREKKGISKALYATLDLLLEVTTKYDNNWKVIQGKSLEADDLTHPLIKVLDIDKESKCLLISNDKDWARNINNNIHWFNWKKCYTENLYLERFGYSPVGKKVQLDKCIRGDRADSINAGLPHLPKKLFLHIVNTYTDVYDLIRNCKHDEKLTKWLPKIYEHKTDLTSNFVLTDFIPIQKNIYNEIIHGERNPRWLDVFYGALQIEKEDWFKDFDVRKKEKAKGGFWNPGMPAPK